MVIAFVPAVTLRASQTFGACILVNADRFGRVPLLALLRLVLNLLRFAAKVLPVMRVDTRLSIVGGVYEGTPHGFVVKEVEICVVGELVNQVDAHLCFVVGERAVLSIVAESRLREMVEFFDARVTVNAGLSLGTRLFLSDETAKFGGVLSGWTSAIFGFVVVVGTLLQIVVWIVALATFLGLERI